jgi:hypothetical protein
MTRKRIALIGYPSDYFQSFGEALEQSGFEVYWVHSSRSAAKDHFAKFPPTPDRILDTTQGFQIGQCDYESAKRHLAELESPAGPRINDVILMDRILREHEYGFALCYVNHLRETLTQYFTKYSITLVSSGRDTALQLIAMLVCKKLGIAWVAPTRVRVPHDMYMFGSGHETADLIRIRPTTQQDRLWAEKFLTDFMVRAPKGLLKAATTNFSDVLRMSPRHARVFWSLLTKSVVDRGNRFSRFTIGRIVGKYVTRRANLVRFKLSPPYSRENSSPFCLYALHTQPESSIDVSGSFFSDQTALITFIARSLPISHELYVKIHPTDVDGKSLSFYRRIAAIPGVRLINYDANSRELIQRASIVFALTGTAGYEAGLLGRPVVTFARNFYNKMPTVHYCSSPPELPALIGTLLCAETPNDVRERLIDFLADIKAQSFEGEVNRMYQPNAAQLNEQDLRNLQLAYSTVYDVVASGIGP